MSNVHYGKKLLITPQVTKDNENMREVNRQEVDKLKENLALLEAQLHNLPDTPYGRSTSNQEIE